jgi:hypothetical protein
MAASHTFTAQVWLYPGDKAAWHFITVPKALSQKLKKKHGANARGWGSIPVQVHIGKSVWKSSMFPDSKSGTYLLPLKASIRKSQGLFEGDRTKVRITVLI